MADERVTITTTATDLTRAIADSIQRTMAAQRTFLVSQPGGIFGDDVRVLVELELTGAIDNLARNIAQRILIGGGR